MSKITNTKLNRKVLATRLAKQEMAYQQGVQQRRLADTQPVEHTQEDVPPMTVNELADMAWALHRCFQCGTQQTPEEIEHAVKVRAPGSIVICQICKDKIERHNAGELTDLTVPWIATYQPPEGNDQP
jgi:uncharacterized CHY-type Zn-finger protein